MSPYVLQKSASICMQTDPEPAVEACPCMDGQPSTANDSSALQMANTFPGPVRRPPKRCLRALRLCDTVTLRVAIDLASGSSKPRRDRLGMGHHACIEAFHDVIAMTCIGRHRVDRAVRHRTPSTCIARRHAPVATAAHARSRAAASQGAPRPAGAARGHGRCRSRSSNPKYTWQPVGRRPCNCWHM